MEQLPRVLESFSNKNVRYYGCATKYKCQTRNMQFSLHQQSICAVNYINFKQMVVAFYLIPNIQLILNKKPFNFVQLNKRLHFLNSILLKSYNKNKRVHKLIEEISFKILKGLTQILIFLEYKNPAIF